MKPAIWEYLAYLVALGSWIVYVLAGQPGWILAEPILLTALAAVLTARRVTSRSNG